MTNDNLFIAVLTMTTLLISLTRAIMNQVATQPIIESVQALYNGQLNEEDLGRITNAVESTVAEVLQTLQGIRDANMNDEQAIAHLTQNRKTMMRTALDSTTFQMQFDGNNPQTVEFKRNYLYSTIPLSTGTNISTANLLQIASVAVESINVVLKTIGINIPNDSMHTKKITDYVKVVVTNNNSLRRDIAEIKNNRFDLDAMVNHMFILVINAYDEGVLLEIVKQYFDRMEWRNWLVIAAKIIAFLRALSIVHGSADIAAIVRRLNVGNAEAIVQMLNNLENIETINRDRARRARENLR